MQEEDHHPEGVNRQQDHQIKQGATRPEAKEQVHREVNDLLINPKNHTREKAVDHPTRQGLMAKSAMGLETVLREAHPVHRIRTNHINEEAADHPTRQGLITKSAMALEKAQTEEAHHALRILKNHMNEEAVDHPTLLVLMAKSAMALEKAQTEEAHHAPQTQINLTREKAVDHPTHRVLTEKRHTALAAAPHEMNLPGQSGIQANHTAEEVTKVDPEKDLTVLTTAVKDLLKNLISLTEKAIVQALVTHLMTELKSHPANLKDQDAGVPETAKIKDHSRVNENFRRTKPVIVRSAQV